MKLEYSRVGFWLVGDSIFRLGGLFVVVAVKVVEEVEVLELVVECVIRLVWRCFYGRLYFLWYLGLMLV